MIRNNTHFRIDTCGRAHSACPDIPYLSECGVLYRLFWLGSFHNLQHNKRKSAPHFLCIICHTSCLMKRKFGKFTISQAVLILTINNKLKLRNIRVQLWDYWIYYLEDVHGVDITLTSLCADCQMVLCFEDAHIVAMKARLYHKIR